MSECGDYIVYVHESGDHKLISPGTSCPMFVLALCIFHIPLTASKLCQQSSD